MVLTLEANVTGWLAELTLFLPVYISKLKGNRVSVQEPQAAAVSLPPEPAAGDASGCSIAVRFPDGQRQQRRFPRQAPISAVAAFCQVSNEEAAAGRPFTLAQPYPGEPFVDFLLRMSLILPHSWPGVS